jgi:hypothetical protein
MTVITVASAKVLKPAAKDRNPCKKLVLKPLVFFMKFMKFMRLYLSFHINSQKNKMAIFISYKYIFMKIEVVQFIWESYPYAWRPYSKHRGCCKAARKA